MSEKPTQIVTEADIKDAADVFGDDFASDYEESKKSEDARLEDIEKEEEAEEPETPVEEAIEKYKDSAWGPDPCIPDQYIKHDWSVRFTAPVTLTCDTSDPDQLSQLNKVRSMARVQDCPRAIIDEYEKNFFEGKYFVYLVYRKVEYKQFA